MTEMQLSDEVATETLEELIGGYQSTQALYVMAKLGIADGWPAAGAWALATAIGARRRLPLRSCFGARVRQASIPELSPGEFALTCSVNAKWTHRFAARRGSS
jgi:hypothetical protein